MEMMSHTPQSQNQTQNKCCSCGGFADFFTGRIRKIGFRITGSKKKSISADTEKKGCKLHNIMNSSFMDRLPSDVIFNIFSRVPVKCLARSRCVSKVWCSYIDDRYLTIIHDNRVVEEPTPILYYKNLPRDRIYFHVIESKQPGMVPHTSVWKPKEEPCLEYVLKVPPPPSRYPILETQVRGSCNGLMFLSEDNGYVIASMAVVHPLRKEWYELPPFPLRLYSSMRRGSCGLGFDTSINTWKVVCILLKEYTPQDKPDMVKKNLCTMVHIFGTKSWTEIPKVPSYPVQGNAVFANSCLHWLVSNYIDIKPEDGGRELIWFDANKEEFGLIKLPKRMYGLWRHRSCCFDQLVDLNGEVGYVCGRTMEVWVLKQKEWVTHCRFKEEILPNGYIDVVGCWNNDGDILIKIRGGVLLYVFYVYNLKSGVLRKTNIDGSGGCHIFMYPNTLSSIHGVNPNPSP